MAIKLLRDCTPFLSNSTLAHSLRPILEIKERFIVEHVSDLKYKGREFVDVVLDATRLLQPMKANSCLFIGSTWGKVLSKFLLKIYPCVDGANALDHIVMLLLPL